jgi:hypothetical protein
MVLKIEFDQWNIPQVGGKFHWEWIQAGMVPTV